MSAQAAFIIVAVLAVIIALAVRGGGPRVTQITRRHEEKDRDDA